MLILSRFAGAAIGLDRALLVNPYDPEAVAGAIAEALAMSLEERRARHQDLLAAISEHDVVRWQSEFLQELRGADARHEARGGLTDTSLDPLPILGGAPDTVGTPFSARAVSE